jgi:hypothetical protein
MTSSSRPPATSTRPVTYRAGRGRGGLEEAGLVQPEPGHTVQARGVVHQLGAMIGHRPHHRGPADPRSRATAATAWASVPTRRQASARARQVSTARAGSRPSARSRSGPHRPARHSATPACARPAPPDGRRSAGPAPAPCGEHGVGLGCRKPRSPPWWRCLDPKPPLLIHDLGGGDLEPVQAEQDRP